MKLFGCLQGTRLPVSGLCTEMVSIVQKQSWLENVSSVASDSAVQTSGHAGAFVQILLNTLGESLCFWFQCVWFFS